MLITFRSTDIHNQRLSIMNFKKKMYTEIERYIYVIFGVVSS